MVKPSRNLPVPRSVVQLRGMLPTSPSVQPDPMPAMSPVSPEVGGPKEPLRGWGEALRMLLLIWKHPVIVGYTINRRDLKVGI